MILPSARFSYLPSALSSSFVYLWIHLSALFTYLCYHKANFSFSFSHYLSSSSKFFINTFRISRLLSLSILLISIFTSFSVSLLSQRVLPLVSCKTFIPCPITSFVCVASFTLGSHYAESSSFVCASPLNRLSSPRSRSFRRIYFAPLLRLESLEYRVWSTRRQLFIGWRS